MFKKFKTVSKWKKCLNCGETNSPIRETTYNLSGEYKLRFCTECWEKRLIIKAKKEEERIRRYEVEQEKIKEDLRIEEMRRKVEVYELENKMKEYGLQEENKYDK